MTLFLEYAVVLVNVLGSEQTKVKKFKSKEQQPSVVGSEQTKVKKFKPKEHNPHHYMVASLQRRR